MKKICAYIVTAILTTIARLILSRHQPTVIAITGSVGKTTTKDIIYAVLCTGRTVRANYKSLNSDVGIPLAIFGRVVENNEYNIIVWLGHIVCGIRQLLSRNFPEIIVLEVGAGMPGDIGSKAQWLRPYISVFTALAAVPVHIEFFADRTALFNEKKQLAVHTRPTGAIVYNNNDEFLPTVLGDCMQTKITTGSNADVSVSFVANTPLGVDGTIQYLGVSHPVHIPGVWGTTYLQSLGLAIAVAGQLGLDISECVDNFAQYFHPNPGRMRILAGIDGSTIVDDSYNASPIAVQSALSVLDQVSTSGRKIFVFGDMKELGSFSQQAHVTVGQQASGIVDMLITIGIESALSGDAARQCGMSESAIFHFDTSDLAGAFLAHQIQAGDVVLAKSSRHAIAMERALVQIIDPAERGNLVQEYLKNV